LRSSKFDAFQMEEVRDQFETLIEADAVFGEWRT
jgi:hypothetical protein